MYLSDAEKAGIAELATTLRERFGATEVTLFGSAVRGTMEWDSDVDIFVVLPELDRETDMAIVDECFELGLRLERHISPLTVSSDRLTNTPFRSAPIVSTIRREGQPL